MPIYLYECPMEHETEFLKLSSSEKEPKFCEQSVNYVGCHSSQCGLPLTKKVATTNWQYTKGKNVAWP